MKRFILPLIISVLSLISCLASVKKSEFNVPQTAGISHYFEVTEFTEKHPHSVLLILDPLFFNPEALQPMASYFASEGYRVLILEVKDPGPPVTMPDEAQLTGAVEMVKRLYPGRPVFAMGVSLSGIAWAPFLEQNESGLSGIIFNGTGFDYDYPGSFYNMVAGFKNEGTSLTELCMTPGKCPSFVRPDLVSAGIRMEDLPLRPKGLTGKQILNYFRTAKIPVAFVNGKIDGIAPEETVYPAIRDLGSQKTETNPQSRNFYLEASTANGMNTDYDHFDLFTSADAEDEIYGPLEEWMNERRAENEN